jgi:predicted amidohydrolase YtcJ
MKKVSLLLVLILFLLSSCKERVDLLVHNANIYTANENFDKATAFVVKNGRFVEVGGEDLIYKYKPTNVVDAQGLPVYPGFIDSNCDLLGLGLNKFKVNLIGSKSIIEVISRLNKHQATYNQKYLHGIGWDQKNWESQELANNKKLNEAFPDIPVVLELIDRHLLLANEKALEIADIDEFTNVEGGEIKSNKGELTGILIDNAINLLHSLKPEFSRKDQIDALIAAQDICFENGLTTIDQDGISKNKILLIDSLQRKKLINIRIYAMIENDFASMDYFFKKGGIKNELLNVNSVEINVDGFLSSRGAALKENYSDFPEYNSQFIVNRDSLNSIAKLLLENSFQMNASAYGDSANEMILDTYNSLLSDSDDPRWRIQHINLISKEDISKFNNKIIPSIQPSQSVSQMQWAKIRLGTERIKDAFAYKDLLDWSGVLALGSNAPFEKISPINTFYAAVTRSLKDKDSRKDFQMKNLLTRYEALMGMTRWAAYANFEENEKGSIEAGKFADFIFLDRDIMTIDMTLVPRTRVVATILNGKIVFSNRL